MKTPLPFPVLLATLLLQAVPTELPAATPDRIATTEVIGTSLRVTTRQGRVIEGLELAGATLSLAAPGMAPQRLRLDEIRRDETDPDGEILLYRVSLLDAAGGGSEYCEADPQGQRWVFPLRGQWDAQGVRVADSGFTLTCSAGAQGKCLRFGYKPWKVLPDGTDLAPYHASCVRMVRADYCGGQPTTRNGMLIDLDDRLGIQRPATGAGQDDLTFEAGWGPDGAVCVAHTRVPDTMSLPGLATTCPRLRDRLGPAACSRAVAESGRLGTALIFNRSR